MNDSLTLTDIPPQAFDYRLGNRSAIEWIIDQYRVQRNEAGEITSDPNRHDDAEYIVRLLGQVIAISVRTVEIIKSLPKSFGGPPSRGALDKATAIEEVEVSADSSHDGVATKGTTKWELRSAKSTEQMRLRTKD